MSTKNALNIGWAEADITPDQPVFVSGQFPARVSEEVLDPIKAIALVMQNDKEHAVMVCCDLVCISEDLYDLVRQKVAHSVAEIDPLKIILNTTHTHTAPEIRPTNPEKGGMAAAGAGVELDAMPVIEYLEFASTRIVEAIAAAWESRAPGGISYGSGFAVLGRNRRWVDRDGVAMMYGLNNESAERFQHIEGYEDHSVNLLATYDAENNLTGIIFNAPMTAQETGGLFAISADIWCEARQELRKRFGKKLYIFTQVSAAGELTPKLLYDKATHERMLQLKGITARQEFANRIANSIEDILPHLPQAIDQNPSLIHLVNTVDLPVNALSEANVEEAKTEIEKLKKTYEEELKKLEDDPSLKDEKRWYVPVSQAYRRMNWYRGVLIRYEQQKTQATLPAELHTIRLGDIIFATNPFEYYVDFGVQIKLRSPALQTFLVELAGSGTYVPSLRSTQGGGYGSMPASNPIGPEGGQVLAEKTVQLIRSLWEKDIK
jgi:hypothetical protein